MSITDTESPTDSYILTDIDLDTIVSRVFAKLGIVTPAMTHDFTDGISPSHILAGELISQINQTSSFIHSGKTSFANVGVGYILGLDASDDLVKFYIGDSTSYFNWTGTQVVIAGNITATSGRIANWYINTNTLTSGATEAASNVLIDSANSLLRLGPTSGNYITLDGANQKISSSNFMSGSTGAGFSLNSNILEVGDLRARGRFSSTVFEVGSIAAVGGSVLISKSSDTLATAMTALDASTVTIIGSVTLAVNDIIRIKDAANDEWMLVTNVNSAPTYTVTRDQAAAYAANTNPAWGIGNAVVNYGPSGSGAIFMTAGETPGPRFDVLTHAGSPWTAITTRLRIGNLNGFLDYTGDLYGIAIGSASSYLKYDPTNGLRIQSDNSKINVGTGGYISGAKTSYSDTTEGFFLGQDAGEHKFNIGDATEYMKWTGDSLLVIGGFDASSPVSLAVYTMANLPIPAVDTGFNAPTAIS